MLVIVTDHEQLVINTGTSDSDVRNWFDDYAVMLRTERVMSWSAGGGEMSQREKCQRNTGMLPS